LGMFVNTRRLVLAIPAVKIIVFSSFLYNVSYKYVAITILSNFFKYLLIKYETDSTFN
jgi:hypothetical protein